MDQAPDKPPIIFVSQHGRPGDYDPLARPARPAGEAEAIVQHRPMAMGTPPDLPHVATGASGYRGTDPDPGDEDEEELVIVRG